MSKSHHKTRLIAIAFGLFLSSVSFVQLLNAQTQGKTSASIPSQIATAKRVLVANAGEEDNKLCQQAYEIFSQNLQKSGRYQLVDSPSAAELILELHYTATPNVVQVAHGDSGSGYVFRFRVLVIDRDTHTTLWSLTEFVDTSDRKKSFEQAFDEALNRLATDLEMLHDGQSASTSLNTSGRNH